MKKSLLSTILVLSIGMLLPLLYSCQEAGSGGGGGGGGSSAGAPKVKTLSDTYVGVDYASVMGQVTDDNGYEIEQRGFCWSKSGTPTVNNNVTYDVYYMDDNQFYGYLYNLQPNTTYYYRAFAVNEKGIGYGEKRSVKTSQGVSDWLYYDNGSCDGAIGLTNGGSFKWAVMFPASYFNTSCTLTKVKLYDMYDENKTDQGGVFRIYTGGTSSPGTLQYSQDYYCYNEEKWVEFSLNDPVYLSGSENVWVVFDNSYWGHYVAAHSVDQGYSNGRWIYLNGSWYDIANDGWDLTWMIRAYVTNSKGEEVPIESILDKEKMEADRQMNAKSTTTPNGVWKSYKK